MRTKKQRISIFMMLLITSTTVLSTVLPVSAEEGTNSTGNILMDNDAMALYSSDIEYLEMEKDDLFSELPILSDIESFDFEGTRKENIKSKGIIDYADGKVVIDATDFLYLANEIDKLEAAYKINTVAALNYMGTYYTEDGSVTHDRSEEGLPAEYAVTLSFDEIYEGVLQSQSVEHLAVSETITGASADNLTTGTAAWLDGELVVGNGADNDANYNKGYSDGRNDGYQAGYTDGRTQGREDVKANPDAYGISTSPKYANMGRGTLTYTVPKAGTYNIIAGYEWHNNGGNNAVGTHITLDIDGEIISLYELKTDSGAGPQNIKRTLPAGAVIRLIAEDNYISENTVAFAVGFLVVS